MERAGRNRASLPAFHVSAGGDGIVQAVAGWVLGAALAALVAGAAAAQGPEMPPEVPLPPGVVVQPLAAPMAVGGEAWGPFRRICFRERSEDGTRPGQEYRRHECHTITAFPGPGGARLSVAEASVPLRIRIDRSAEGEVSGASVLPWPGRRPPGAEEEAEAGGALRDLFRFALAPTRRLGMGDAVRVRDPASYGLAAAPWLKQAAEEVPCTVAGRARYRNRPVAVLRCEGRSETRAKGDTVRAARRAVVLADAATGLFLHARQHYRIVATPEAGGSPMAISRTVEAGFE